ncbi:S-adenosylhomocysteine hydrolase [Rubrobacter radiotolerans]|uniref:Adenosylhomocysteinase n=1 Tax=Rubrobacter radiotolerans TaxID=42256 RepID=A0A023X516_RUBRA|nr:adenosylhomocysteinase [Rubrobacter radiotolerans]AHY47060.1 S-adenosylhomocysteine hydrolase [Rubrobacter radiotolerans]MDX5894466.1 adenosylhomocysteinase [Rubrobacter radiotolerans]SMC06061.1 adenosylhomocysteinase [Rubrobacter radiotolerans DSM 5868]
MIKDSIIKDPSLADEGHKKIDWAAQHSPVLNDIARKQLADGSLKGRKVAVTVHLEAKTAYLAVLLHEAGAEVTVTGSNPLSTQDAVCAALVERGVRVFATHDPSEEDFERYIHLALETEPDLLLDDGAELAARLVESHPDLMEKVEGATETTTTGILKLRAMSEEGVLPFPVLGINEARMKHLFDNRYGTGHSSIVSLLANTNLFLSGKRVVIMGFGWVSRGLAKYAAGFGARVIVCEPDPVKLLEAHSEGYEVMNSLEAAEVGDFFLTGTGNLKVLRREHFERMKDGAVLANAGHYDHEFDLAALREMSVTEREARRNITEYELPNGNRIHVIARGRLLNSGAGDGHPVEIMDLTFALHALGIHHLASSAHSFEPGIQALPEELDREVARIKLRTMGVRPEELTEEQIRYQKSWR